ncbi:NGO_0222 family membrane protein [Kingella negevensis]|uniref:Uncharacterized protein n=1 Tax=Kingella negevensis TaxID=1522312 RepID=A0A238TD56_9NEIS|nr:NGO_0222 family membrane protein [Kingella negevensis]MDK4679993.1 hypothetical protein [Kingella negevensis]MDK4682287.1 hypothetical protein [Kingella negevensis]MDK4684855.1 hypothetical protein [Kingella negevensis]MDK4688311.1 hypothetical protein [Kingella negevensis]MDK4690484.1 hypothetical protein [Kingella negevensis]
MEKQKLFLFLTLLFSFIFLLLIGTGVYLLSLKTQPEKQYGIAAILFAIGAASAQFTSLMLYLKAKTGQNHAE